MTATGMKTTMTSITTADPLNAIRVTFGAPLTPATKWVGADLVKTGLLQNGVVDHPLEIIHWVVQNAFLGERKNIETVVTTVMNVDKPGLPYEPLTATVATWDVMVPGILETHWIRREGNVSTEGVDYEGHSWRLSIQASGDMEQIRAAWEKSGIIPHLTERFQNETFLGEEASYALCWEPVALGNGYGVRLYRILRPSN